MHYTSLLEEMLKENLGYQLIYIQCYFMKSSCVTSKFLFVNLSWPSSVILSYNFPVYS